MTSTLLFSRTRGVRARVEGVAPTTVPAIAPAAAALAMDQAAMARAATKRDPCLLWEGRRRPDGYGMDGQYRAHRLVFERMYGPIPPKILVCHSCDMPPCVNPEHLFLGTNKDNSDDKIRKGRLPVYAGWRKPPRLHCNCGHKYTRSYLSRDGRLRQHCRICDMRRSKEYREKRK